MHTYLISMDSKHCFINEAPVQVVRSMELRPRRQKGSECFS